MIWRRKGLLLQASYPDWSGNKWCPDKMALKWCKRFLDRNFAADEKDVSL